MSTSTGQSDESLFATYIETSDPEAFGTLYDRFHAPLLNFLRRYFGDDLAPAEDAIQQAFQRVFEHASQFRPDAKFSAWLYSIASHCAIDIKRHAARGNYVSFNSVPSEEGANFEYDPCDTAPDAEAILERREGHSRLLAVLQDIDPQDRRLVEMTYFDGASYVEAAAALGWSVNNCRVRLCRLLKYLRGELEAA